MFCKKETAASISTLFDATDETSINAKVEQIIKDNGFEPVHVGGLNQSIGVEIFGDLRKTVTADEAKAKI